MTLRDNTIKAFNWLGWMLFIVEASLAANCPKSEKRLLSLCGWLVCLNHILLGVAALEISQLITAHWLSEAVIFALLFLGTSAIYRLLLTTFSSDRLPHTAGIKAINPSIIISLFFLGFISLLVSKPLELIVFSEGIEQEMSIFRQEKTVSFYKENLTYFDDEIFQLQNKLTAHKKTTLTEERINIENTISALCDRRQRYINEFDFVNSNAQYLTARFILLYRHFPISWLITIMIFLLYLIPFIAKIKWFKSSSYQMKCDNSDYEQILTNYFQFEYSYKKTFRDCYKIEANIYDSYTDPPFNTCRRTDSRHVVDLKTLLSRYSNNSEI